MGAAFGLPSAGKVGINGTPAIAGVSYCTPGRTRIPNLLIRSQTLYPIELRALVQGHKVLLPRNNGKPNRDVWHIIRRRALLRGVRTTQ